MLYSLHLGVAALTQQPLLALSEPESAALAEAVAIVADQYDWLQVVSPAVIAWGNLGKVVATIYGPRVAMISAARKSKPAPGASLAQRPATAPASPFPPPASPAGFPRADGAVEHSD